MRKSLIFLVLSVSVGGTPALHAQDRVDHAGNPSHHMAMMMQHHSVATVDLLVSHRDSLKLTDDQLEKLAELRQQFVQAGGHAMHGAGMGMMMEPGKAMGPGMDMGAMMQPRRPHVTFDRVPGKMVPRVSRPSAGHCPMCPFAVLTRSQREKAHQLMGQQGHQHQG